MNVITLLANELCSELECVRNDSSALMKGDEPLPVFSKTAIDSLESSPVNDLESEENW